MSNIKRTLKEWENVKDIEILDYDGFDRTDDKLFDKSFTEEEFDEGVIRCTIMLKADKSLNDLKSRCVFCGDVDFSHNPEILKCVNEYNNLIAEKERLKQELDKTIESYTSEYNTRKDLNRENEQLKVDLKEAKADKLYYREQVELISKQNEQLRKALKKCDPSYRQIGDLCLPYLHCKFCCRQPITQGHKPDCEYVRLCGGIENE